MVELQNAKARFERQGLKVAAISYDCEEILKYFAGRREIDFPLLADPDSKTIRAYQVLNTEAVGQFKGMARPGFFFIDTKGVTGKSFSKGSTGTGFQGITSSQGSSLNWEKR